MRQYRRHQFKGYIVDNWYYDYSETLIPNIRWFVDGEYLIYNEYELTLDSFQTDKTTIL